MKLSIIGSGYVGTTVAACLAHLGHDVVNVDVDPEVVESINSGESPVHEPRLGELIAENSDSLRATTEFDEIRETRATFICVPTPSNDDGSLDLGAVRSAAGSVGESLAEKGGYHVVVTKSTVLPSTTDTVVAPLVEEASGKQVGDELGVAVNPEFLREGTAVDDFLGPDKVVVGAADERARDTLHEVYEPLASETSETAFVDTGLREAEMIKYANNAMLASKLSVVNELGNIAKRLDIDTYEVTDAVGLDGRIAADFMRSGLGWGGSCFPKDVDAVRAFAREHGYEPELLDAVVSVNDGQPRRMVDLLEKHVDIADARVALLGLAFKPGTDDVRNSRALDLVRILVSEGADVVAYDPQAAENAREALGACGVEYAGSAEEALEDADACLIATEWPEFDGLDFEGMRRKVVVDGRRVDIDEDALDVYEGLCW